MIVPPRWIANVFHVSMCDSMWPPLCYVHKIRSNWIMKHASFFPVSLMWLLHDAFGSLMFLRSRAISFIRGFEVGLVMLRSDMPHCCFGSADCGHSVILQQYCGSFWYYCFIYSIWCLFKLTRSVQEWFVNSFIWSIFLTPLKVQVWLCYNKCVATWWCR